jgi:hypothetical protein
MLCYLETAQTLVHSIAIPELDPNQIRSIRHGRPGNAPRLGYLEG